MTPVEIGDVPLTALALGPAASYTSPGETGASGPAAENLIPPTASSRSAPAFCWSLLKHNF